MAQIRWITLALCALMLTGCNRKEYVFKSDPLGHGPNEYEIYTDRPPVGLHAGEDTQRAGVMILPPIQPLARTPARQKEVLQALIQFYEKLYNLDEIRAKDSVKWLNKFLTEHGGLAPDQPVAIQSALDTLVRAKERGAKAMAEAPNETSKAAIAEQMTKLEKEIEYYTKYVQERPAKAAEYQAYIDAVDAANKRMQMWQARHIRMSNTLEWVQTTSGSADAELNRAMREMSELLAFNDDQTKMEAIAMAVNLGGSDARQLHPRVKAVADDARVTAEVRAFAATAAKSIESQGG